jgi:hypothetical protein
LRLRGFSPPGAGGPDSRPPAEPALVTSPEPVR